MSGSDSTPVTVATRPLIPAGPMERTERPARRAGSIEESAAKPGEEEMRMRIKQRTARRDMGFSFGERCVSVYHWCNTDTEGRTLDLPPPGSAGVPPAY